MKLKFDTNKTYAVCLEGGGARGAYQIGAFEALKEAGVKITAASGSSVGALNGALIAMDAVMQVQTGEYESGKIAQELQKGYMYHDQVLRHSMVAVEA